ncbi:MAG TPA: rhomboid family intramembrane serine protease [Cytophagaceae bacterium]
MNNLFDELKDQFKKQDNGLVKLILINVIVFLIINIIYVFSEIFNTRSFFYFIENILYIPAPIQEFIRKPWTIVTYAFSHQNILHILFNMLFLYWFGKLIHEYLGNRRLINLYILGALSGAILYLLLFNLVPYYIQRAEISGGMLGASAAVYAIVVAAATLLPHHRFFLIFIGPVKIAYIAAFFIVMSFIGSVDANAGGNIAHLGGAFMGFIFIKQLQRGRDLGKPLTAIAEFISRLFTRRSTIKVSYRGDKKSSSNAMPKQEEIDAILDKISRSGYESLTKEEKQKLFRASQKGQ